MFRVLAGTTFESSDTPKVMHAMHVYLLSLLEMLAGTAFESSGTLKVMYCVQVSCILNM